MQFGRRTRGPGRATRAAGTMVAWLVGLAVGALLGVLLAPHRGDITRRRLARRAEEARDHVRKAVDDLCEGRVVHRADEETEG